MQKGHELLIPTAHAHLEFLALMKIKLFYLQKKAIVQ